MRGRPLHPYRRLIWVWVALLVLLILTFASAFVPLGGGNALVNLVIAGMKASLVATIYMHLRRSAALLPLVSATALLMLALLFALSGADYATRQLYPAQWHPRANAGADPPHRFVNDRRALLSTFAFDRTRARHQTRLRFRLKGVRLSLTS